MNLLSDIKKIIYIIKTVVANARLTAVMYILLSFTSAAFISLKIYFLKMLVDSVTQSTMYIKPIITWGLLFTISLVCVELYTHMLGFLGRRLKKALARSFLPAAVGKFEKIEYQYFEDPSFNDLMARISVNPHEKIRNSFYAIIGCFKNIISLAGILLIFFNVSVWLGLGALIFGIPMFIMELRVAKFNKNINRAITKDQRLEGYMNDLFYDKNCVYESKIFSLETFLLNLWKDKKFDIINERDKVSRKSLKNFVITNMLKLIFTAFTVVLMTVFFIHKSVSLGTLISISNSLPTLFSVMLTTALSVSSLVSSFYDIEYLTEFMNFDEREINNLHSLPDKTENITIEFANVSFSYPNTDIEILHDISFKINTDEKIALYGANGAGKSTIIKLLFGLYPPTKGNILIGGINIKNFTSERLSQIFSVVFQDFQKYEMPLKESISLGSSGDITDEMLRNALRKAGGDDIANMDLDTETGYLSENAVNLSGGQWQKLALSRIYVGDQKYGGKRKFAVLDEPTASLDPIAESLVYESFLNVLNDGNGGTLIISHRLASSKLTDKIILLDSGKIADIGSHAELMNRCNLYRTMYDRQRSWYTQNYETETV